MSLSLQESLAKLVRLSPSKLHQTSQRLRAELGGAEWKLSLCLLATARKRTYRNLGFANISEYAEKALQLSGQKAGCLLGTARALEHLPLLSEAFREGRIGWGKLRAIRGLATPETERQWLDFALSHHTDQVVRKVSLSPASWKRHQALQASLEGNPVATEHAVIDLLERAESGPDRARHDASAAPCDRAEEPNLRCSIAGPPEAPAMPAESVASAVPANQNELANLPCDDSAPSQNSTGDLCPASPIDPAALLPSPPRTIRLVIELSPDQYALYERAESRIRAQARRHISRAKVLTKMSEAVLNSGTARSRAKHQVLIHTEAETGKAWYDTQKGPLPVDASILHQATELRAPLQVQAIGESGPTRDSEDGQDPSPQYPETALNVRNSKSNRAASTVQAPLTQPAPAPQTAKHRRKAIPNATLRRLFAQAGHQCQRCGARDALLDVHHTHPVSEGGGHQLETLRVLCLTCHSQTHESDYATKPQWRTAKLANQRRTGSPPIANFGPTGNRRLDEP